MPSEDELKIYWCYDVNWSKADGFITGVQLLKTGRLNIQSLGFCLILYLNLMYADYGSSNYRLKYVFIELIGVFEIAEFRPGKWQLVMQDEEPEVLMNGEM